MFKILGLARLSAYESALTDYGCVNLTGKKISILKIMTLLLGCT